ncbi:glycoside hydrolase [Flagelloscypha sp. PMI_526]|nr:glycoside hydrolase [Flagelloscypha sp. PMI_526]
MALLYTSLLAISLLPTILAHGQVRYFYSSYGTWSAADAYAAANASSPIRKLNTYGPAADFTNINITCGEGGNTPVAALAKADAGSVVTFDWGSWGSSHSGPLMTYIADCGSAGCASFKGDSGAVWAKFDQDGYNPARTDYPWGENLLHKTPSVYSVTIPASIKPGQYIIRHEVLGLHVAGTLMGAQFYPNCIQVQIVNGGTKSLPSTGKVALPGAYIPTDPGILTQLWWYNPSNTTASYTVPAGPVLTF